MKRIVAMLCCVALLFSLAACGKPSGDKGEQASDLPLAAAEFVNSLAFSQFDTATRYFNAEMQAALKADDLKTVWAQATQQYGAFQSCQPQELQEDGDSRVVQVKTVFEKGVLGFNVNFDKENRISGVHFVPYEEKVDLPQGLKEEDLAVVTGEYSLPAKLTRPTADGKHPALILVHGSGPQDMNETVGPNKPFRDIAWGLAAQNIAVLRYDKRTYTYGAQMSQTVQNMTVEQEILEDVASAVALLKSNPSVDPERIYILGHSMGGMMLPRIAQKAPEAAGLISLAGNARPLEDLMAEQSEYLMSIDETIAQADKDAYLAEMKKQIENVKGLTKDSQLPADQLLGLEKPYWLDLNAYKPTELVKSVTVPMLFLQGGRDYQVTQADLDLWKNATAGMDATYQLYPDLNHLFMTGEGKSVPDEYQAQGTVAQEVIADIAAWMLQK